MAEGPETDPWRKEFGRRVRRRRMACGFSQVELAEKADIQQTAISRIESGGYQAMNLKMLARLGDALQTTVDYLLQRTDDAGEVPEKQGSFAVV